METHKIYDYADRYVAGKLSEKERDFVDQQMSEEGDFARIFVTYLAANEAAKRLADEQEKERLMALFASDSESKNNPTKTLKLKPQIRKLLVAAAIAAVCLVGYWLWHLPREGAIQVAVQELYQERIYDRVLMGDDAQFYRLFQEGKYAAALALLQAATNPSPQNIERQGFCYWQLGQMEAALLVFERLKNNPLLKPKQNKARFYLALTYWKMNDKGKCRALLKELSKETGHVYQEKASQLLREI